MGLFSGGGGGGVIIGRIFAFETGGGGILFVRLRFRDKHTEKNEANCNIPPS